MKREEPRKNENEKWRRRKTRSVYLAALHLLYIRVWVDRTTKFKVLHNLWCTDCLNDWIRVLYVAVCTFRSSQYPLDSIQYYKFSFLFSGGLELERRHKHAAQVPGFWPRLQNLLAVTLDKLLSVPASEFSRLWNNSTSGGGCES